MRQSPWESGRAGSTAPVQGRKQELCPKLPPLSRGNPVASQSSTASQSKGTHGQWTRSFEEAGHCRLGQSTSLVAGRAKKGLCRI